MDPVISIGAPAPAFQLLDIHGINHSLQDMLGHIVLLNFWSAECTWCERLDGELDTFQVLWGEQVTVWWIASNSGEPRELVARVSAQRQLPVVLLDAHQQVADLYGAQTTPHFYVVDTAGRLAYQGSWDDVTFRQRVPTQAYVPKVIDSLLIGDSPEITQTAPYGCVLVREMHESLTG